MGLFEDLTTMAKTMFGQAVKDRLPSVFSDALNGTPLSGLQDQLPGILERMQSGGLREQVQSWIEKGANMHVSPDQIVSAIGEDKVREIASRLGVPEDQAVEMLSKYLPKAVDQGAREAEQAGQPVG